MSGDDKHSPGPDADATGSRPPEIQTGPVTAPAALEIGETLSDQPEHYAIEGRIGAGGMGTVVAARSSRFGRSVAVKMITVDRDDLRRRFEREAHVTARLQHPSIVPVYGSGHSRDGRPFYAMKQVTGQSLDKVVADTPAFDKRMALVPMVIAVSEAIAYAHSEHVIHRDLKPANILVGSFGETIVIDWGLAKDLAVSETSDEEAGSSPYRTAGGDETAYGKVMGTPAYMPPEQARGEPVDMRADVYALGAILYHVLAGAMPYVREGERSVPWESMVARVISEPPPSIRLVQPTAPPDLLAIVERAMARAPGDRYPSARELAEDLKRFQAGQLVGAHRYSTWQLVKRWVRRHRTAVVVAAVAIAALAALGGLSLHKIFAEQARTEAQRVAAERHRGEAEDLMGFMLVNLRDKLAPINKLELLDDVATKAVHYYDGKDDLSADDFAKQVIARSNLAEVLSQRGRTAEADTQLRSAIAISRALVVLDPSEWSWQRNLGVAYQQLGDLLVTQRNRGDDATEQYRAELAIFEDLVAQHPANLAALSGLADAHLRIGNMISVTGNAAGGLAEYRKTLALFDQVAKASPANNLAKSDLARAHAKIGVNLAELGDVQGALVEHRAQLKLLEELVAAHPDDAGARSSLSYAHDRLGDLYSILSDVDNTLAERRATLAILDALARQDPANAAVQLALAKAHEVLGETLIVKEDASHALEEFRLVIAICEPMIASNPDNLDPLDTLANALQGIGDVLVSQKHPEAALVQQRKALAVHAQLAAKDPKNNSRQYALTISHEKVGDALAASGDRPAGIAEYRIAIQLADVMAKREPNNALLQELVADGHSRIAWTLLQKGDAKAAVVEYRVTLAILASTTAISPIDLVSMHQQLADALVAAGDRAGALLEYEAFREGARAMAESLPNDAGAQTRFAAALEKVGDLRLAHGDADAALANYLALRTVAGKLVALEETPDRTADLAEAAERVGDVWVVKRDKAQASAAYGEARTTLQRLIAKGLTKLSIARSEGSDVARHLAAVVRKLDACCPQR